MVRVEQRIDYLRAGTGRAPSQARRSRSVEGSGTRGTGAEPAGTSKTGTEIHHDAGDARVAATARIVHPFGRRIYPQGYYGKAGRSRGAALFAAGSEHSS